MKRRVSAAALALAISTASAFAADLPSTKAPPVYAPPPPPPAWTGFYAGLNAGATWADDDRTTIASGAIFANPALTPFGVSIFNGISAGGNGILPGARSGGAFLGGGQVGYNYQFYNSFVVGLEADIQGVAGASNTSSSGGVFPTTLPGFFSYSGLSATRSLDYLGTVRGRLGWLVTPTVLLYGTGGLAYGGVNASATIFQVATTPLNEVPATISGGAFSDTLTGWTAGGGAETIVLPNWTVKFEYLYFDLGTATYSAGARVANDNIVPVTLWGHVSQASTRFNGHILRAGVNYHFNFGAPAPVIATY